MSQLLNERLAWLRKQRGITLVDLAGMLNQHIGATPETKMFQTSDKVFTYERRAKPVAPKPEVLMAYCKIFELTYEELQHADFETLGLFERWEKQVNMVNEPVAGYNSTDKNELLKLLHEINRKLDKLLKVKK